MLSLTPPPKNVFYDSSGIRKIISKIGIIFIISVCLFILVLFTNSYYVLLKVLGPISGLNYSTKVGSPNNQRSQNILTIKPTQEDYDQLRQHINNINIVILPWLELDYSNFSITTINNNFTSSIREFISTYRPNISIWFSFETGTSLSFLNDKNTGFFAEKVISQMRLHNGNTFVLSSPEYLVNLDSVLYILHNSLRENSIPIYISTGTIDHIVLSIFVQNSEGVVFEPVNISKLQSLYDEISSFPDLRYILQVPSLSIEQILSEQGGVRFEEIIKYNKIESILKNQNGVQSVQLNINSDTFQPQITFKDSDNQNHRIILNDGVYGYNWLQFVNKLSLRPFGLSLANLDFIDPLIIEVVNQSDQNEQITTLTNGFVFDYYIDVLGEGDIYKLKQKFTPGKRYLEINNGLIVRQSITNFPERSKVQRYGVEGKNIALTFDDGPDPNTTPQILDILKNNNIKATFFVIGSNVLLYPELTNRIVKEGHTLGNHTYTHPHTYNLEADTFRRELIAADDAIFTSTGTRPKVFRLPYNDLPALSIERDTNSLELISSVGKVMSKANVDSLDWNSTKKDDIVSSTIKGIDNQKKPATILFHDSGGVTRNPTIAALLDIINELKIREYSFVTVDEQMSKSNTIVSDNEKSISEKEDSSFLSWLYSFSEGHIILKIAIIIAQIYLFICISFGSAKHLILSLLMLYRVIRKPHLQLYDGTFDETVSVLVPCFNEERVITRTIDSILDSDYLFYEIIIIDDGSTDGTVELLKNRYATTKQVTIVTKQNGGKASALNLGIEKSHGIYVMGLDADTTILPNTLSKMMRHFYDPEVSGVAGNVQVGNDNNFITKNQRLEYILGQNCDKFGMQLLNCITVIPGALGVWKKSVVQEIGGYQCDTLAEDTDLTLRLLKHKGKVVYESHALSITEAPETLRSLYKQRFRWQYGTLQSLYKHRSVFLNVRHGFLGLFALPMLISSYIFIGVLPVVDVFILSLFTKIILQLWFPYVPLNSLLQNSFFAGGIVFSVSFLITYLFQVLLSIYLDPSERKWRLSLMVPLHILVYRHITWFVTVRVLIKALYGDRVGWNHLQRTGNANPSRTSVDLKPKFQS